MVLILAFVFAVARVGVDHFVLKNASVQLTIIEGRITSLHDVALEYALSQCLTYSPVLTSFLKPRAHSDW